MVIEPIPSRQEPFNKAGCELTTRKAGKGDEWAGIVRRWFIVSHGKLPFSLVKAL
ncbi:hypothetical protein LBCZ_2698 [Lacticaseibacillus casei DSM 20011 = JCM 1134 = ATCC 393]|uniref:Uncharacterized protein n=1 Tax=Lacticaseibacillus casei DSM 20011 = JCM 1134 = ATCC 393 TaxID=1423732 RepID=A0AAD1ASU0_LACCA|nr:hypothetical protein LBCZ_2698 [Lacticaseibacillus casei DSM 20011 = JCM 1134 = ATCC 393]